MLSDGHFYFAGNACGTSGAYAVKIENVGRAPRRALGEARWEIKSSALGIVGVRMLAKLRRDRGHAPKLWMAERVGRSAGGFGVGRGATGRTLARMALPSRRSSGARVP